MVKVLFVVGSLRAQSFNRELAVAISHLLSDDFQYSFADIKDLPVYNQDNDENMPAPVVAFKKQVAESDAIIFVTPEHNRGTTAAMKNAIDTGSRPYGDNSWAGKPAGILGTSMGAVGTALAQHNLRQTLTILDVKTMPQPEAYVRYHEGLFDANGKILEEGTRKHLENWTKSYEAWVKLILNRA